MKKLFPFLLWVAYLLRFRHRFWKPCLGKVAFPNTRGLLLSPEQTENIGEAKRCWTRGAQKDGVSKEGESSLLLQRLRIFSIYFLRMGNFPTFCRVEKKLTEKETEEVIVILFLNVLMASVMKVIFA